MYAISLIPSSSVAVNSRTFGDMLQGGNVFWGDHHAQRRDAVTPRQCQWTAETARGRT
jgi:hypothetical protein